MQAIVVIPRSGRGNNNLGWWVTQPKLINYAGCRVCSSDTVILLLRPQARMLCGIARGTVYATLGSTLLDLLPVVCSGSSEKGAKSQTLWPTFLGLLGRDLNHWRTTAVFDQRFPDSSTTGTHILAPWQTCFSGNSLLWVKSPALGPPEGLWSLGF